MFLSKIVITTALFIQLFVGVGFAEASESCKGEKWLQGYRGATIAKELRKQHGCGTLTYFMSDYCAACKIIKKELLSQKDFYEGLKGFTKVQLDFQGDWQERHYASKLNIKSIPSFIVLSAPEIENKKYIKSIRLHFADESGQIKVLSVKDAIKTIKEASKVRENE